MFDRTPTHRHGRKQSRRILFTNRDGITSIEFALIVPVFVMMMMGVIEFSLIMFASATMESATGNTARLGKTGFTEEGQGREQTIYNNVVARTQGLFDPNRITITTTTYASLDDIGQEEPYTDTNHNGAYDGGESYDDINGNGQWDEDMGAQGVGDANDIVVYTVHYPWPIMTPVISAILGSTVDITARTVVKNEPFNVQQGG